ncbi:MAG: hypothetical protein ABJR05_05020 [Balneola sp.]
MRHARPDILTRPLFVLAVGLLLLNDFYLKYEFSNFLTGKLSDVAGLFLFPYFLSSLRVKWSKTIYFGTAALFLFWKSPFSQEIINLAQTVGIGFNRVVDYTDLFALFILPFSFQYFQKQLSIEQKIGKYLTIPLGVISLFAIWATTLPREKVELNLAINEEFELEISKTEFFNLIQAGHGYSDTLNKNLTDSLFYLHFDIVDESRIDVTALSTITSNDAITTKVRLDKILHGYITGGLFSGVDKDDVEHFKSISAEEFKAHFRANFIDLIKDGKTENIYFDNKEIHDDYQNE